MGADNRQDIIRQTIKQVGLTTFRKPVLRSEVSPAFLLQFRQVNNACWYDDGFGDKGDGLTLFFLHVLLGVVARGKLNRAGECIIL
jgi:hypothetical protein